MAKGRVNAVMLLFCILVSYSEMANHAYARREYVLDWTFNMSSWPNGKKFSVGDVIVFLYNPALHNLGIVDENGYNSCRFTGGGIGGEIGVYSSGHDFIGIQRPKSYYISTVPGDCSQRGMKMAINAS